MRKNLIIALAILCGNAFTLSIDQIYNYLKTGNNGIYAKYDNITYTQPTTNILRSDQPWLLQTPNLWGHSLAQYQASLAYSGTGKFDPNFNLAICNTDSDCGPLAKCMVANFTNNNEKLCLMPEHYILNSMVNNISNAQYSVDLVTLGKASITTGQFTIALKNSLYKLAQNSLKYHHKIYVRILDGSFIPFTQTKDQQNYSIETISGYINNLVKGLPANNNLNIVVANMDSCNPLICNYGGSIYFDFAWNHAKFINVDSNDLLTGGENYFGDDYMGANPVNDAIIEMVGPIANSATEYANVIWHYVDTHKGISENICYTYANNQVSAGCSFGPQLSQSNSHAWHDLPGMAVSIMSVAKLNHGVLADDADQSELARVYAFKNATTSIKINQQALYAKFIGDILPPVTTIDGDTIQALAYAIYTNNVDVSIVTSSIAKTDGYNANVSLDYVHDQIKSSLIKQFPQVTSVQAELLLSQYLHLAIIDFDGSRANKFRNHNKFWEVDDHIFYFGSHNFYPSGLQQYGVIIDSAEATSQLNSEFWTPTWYYADKL